MTDDLVAFLRARLAEDEQTAQRVQQAYADEEFWAPAAVINAFALVDPARVLAEVQAKRRLLAVHEPYDSEKNGGPTCWVCGPGGFPYPCTTLRLLALPYAGHDSYRAEWAPATEVTP